MQKLRKRVKDVERLKQEEMRPFKAGRVNDVAGKYTEALDVSIRFRIFDNLSEYAR